MIALNVNRVDGFVAKLQRKGVNVRWDGWDMVFFKADRRALRSPKGRRNGEQWGFETRIYPNAKGVWLVNPNLTRVEHG